MAVNLRERPLFCECSNIHVTNRLTNEAFTMFVQVDTVRLLYPSHISPYQAQRSQNPLQSMLVTPTLTLYKTLRISTHFIVVFAQYNKQRGARGGFKQEGRGFDSRRFQWEFFIDTMALG